MDVGGNLICNNILGCYTSVVFSLCAHAKVSSCHVMVSLFDDIQEHYIIARMLY